MRWRTFLLTSIGVISIAAVAAVVNLATGGSFAEGAVQVGTAASANCPDDGLEQNDSQGAARSIGIPTFVGDLRVCTGDDDFYSFALSAGQQIQVHVFFSDAQGDINIGLRDPGGNTVVTSVSENDNEGIVYTAASSGTHYLQVNLFSDGGSPGATYELQLNLTGTCADDVFEQNDTRQTAQSAGPPFYQPNLRACPGDMDWFSMILFGGSSVQIDAFFKHSEGNINISLYDADGGFLAASTSFSDNEKFVYDVPETGSYSVLVFLEAPQDSGLGVGNTYDLQVGQPDGLNPCPDDTFEDNDALGDPAPISIPSYVPALRACFNDYDFYSFNASAGSDISIGVSSNASQGDLAFALYGPGDQFLAGDVLPANAKISFQVASSGTQKFLIALNENTAAGNTYHLQISGPKLLTPTPSATPTQPAAATNTPTRTPTHTPTSPAQSTATNTSAPQVTPTNTSPGQATATPTRTPTRTATPGTGSLPGDANCDGNVNSIDAAVVLQVSAALLGAAPCPVNADVNNDGGINSLDAALVLQRVAGLI